MPKKDGTPTKSEIRQAELYDHLAKLSDHAAAQSRRFKALGFEVDAFVGELKLKPEVVDAILDRLEGTILDKKTEDRIIEYALKGARPEMKHWLGEGTRGYNAADDIAEGIAAGLRRGLKELGLRPDPGAQ